MKKIKSLLFHFKNRTLVEAIFNYLKKIMKLNNGIPIGNSYFGEKAAIYDEHRMHDEYWKAEDNCVNHYLSQISDNINSVIDAPYGTGRFAPIYSKYNLDVTALDISEEMMNIAKVKYKSHINKTKFFVQKIVDIPLNDNSIDLVICFRFLPWIVSFKEAKIALAELSRVCKKYAIIEFCVGEKNTSNKKINENKILWDNYSKDELTLLLKEYNFDVLEIKFLYNDDEHPGLSAFFCKKNDFRNEQ